MLLNHKNDYVLFRLLLQVGLMLATSAFAAQQAASQVGQ
jgi:hypothetical protein